MSSFQQVQERLAKYRSEKKTKIIQSNPDEPITELSSQVSTFTKENDNTNEEVRETIPQQSLQKDNLTVQASSSWSMFALKCILWLLLLGFFIEIEFGIAFFMVSCPYFIYASLRGSRRKPSELSAYSVFNKNFERIEGTLTAEQFEREIRLGPGSVH